MIIPNDRRRDGFPPAPNNGPSPKEMKTLFLLHGYSGLMQKQLPEVFGKTAALSSALIVHEVATMKPEGGIDGKGGNAIANYAYYREFHGFLDSQGVKHVYIESKGIHDMNFWQEYAVKFIPEMMKE